MISVKNLCMGFDLDENLFENVSFEIGAGKSACLIGPSGAGKTVLLKCVAGLLTPRSGTVSIDAGSEVGMLFQKNALFDSFTVIENLLFPLKERKGVEGSQAIEKSQRFLKAVGLADSANLYPNEISGGMQKRLGIARALVIEPSVILYDDPTAGLDPITSRLIADLILQLQTENKVTVLAVTNDMRRAVQMGDDVYLLAQKKLVHAGVGRENATLFESKDPAVNQFVYGKLQGPLTERGST